MSHSIISDMAWLKGSSGPADIAPTRWPAMVKSTTVTLPSGPDGVSAGIAVTWSMRLSGMIET